MTVVSVPADIPEFPIYPNAQVSSIRDTDGEDARDVSLSLTVAATMNDIHAWYRQELSANGWSITSDKNVAGYQIIQAEKENVYTSLQTASGVDGSVTISQYLKVRN